MFPGDLDLWVWLLEQLLGNANYEGDPTHPQDLYKSLYKGVYILKPLNKGHLDDIES